MLEAARTERMPQPPASTAMSSKMVAAETSKVPILRAIFRERTSRFETSVHRELTSFCDGAPLFSGVAGEKSHLHGLVQHGAKAEEFLGQLRWIVGQALEGVSIQDTIADMEKNRSEQERSAFFSRHVSTLPRETKEKQKTCELTCQPDGGAVLIDAKLRFETRADLARAEEMLNGIPGGVLAMVSLTHPEHDFSRGGLHRR